MEPKQTQYDLTGRTINGWEVLEWVSEVQDKSGKVYRCRCSCGEIVWLNTQQIQGRYPKLNCGNPKKHKPVPPGPKPNSAKTKAKPYEQKCITCAKALGDCSWSRKYDPQPVPGWDAQPTKISVGTNRYIQSYAIHDCPLYVKG